AIMLKVPYYLNNPVAILSSTPNATVKGFVFVTDLQYQGNPIIIATHKKQTNRNEVLTMISCYDKKLEDFQKFLNYDILCWDYSKAERFEQIYSGILDLPPHIYPTKDFGKQQRLVFSTEQTVLDSLSPIHQASHLLPYNTSPLYENDNKTEQCSSQYVFDCEKQQRAVFSTEQTVLDNPTPILMVSSLSHNTSPLFVDYDKAERYFRQYFPDLSVNPNLYLDAEKVQQVRNWTRQNAPINRQNAETALMNIYTQFMPSNEDAKQAIHDEIKNELDAVYKQRCFITGADLPLFHSKAQQFGVEYKQNVLTQIKQQLTQAALPPTNGNYTDEQMQQIALIYNLAMAMLPENQQQDLQRLEKYMLEKMLRNPEVSKSSLNQAMAAFRRNIAEQIGNGTFSMPQFSKNQTITPKQDNGLDI
ncbi:MAG: hypothetical protein IKX14_00065, partial [Neisseriaceae bacterium]|nr:hypothetical protein [Neisseriaceae bacterium]